MVARVNFFRVDRAQIIPSCRASAGNNSKLDNDNRSNSTSFPRPFSLSQSLYLRRSLRRRVSGMSRDRNSTRRTSKQLGIERQTRVSPPHRRPHRSTIREAGRAYKQPACGTTPPLSAKSEHTVEKPICVIDPISGLSGVKRAIIENGWLSGTTRSDKVLYRETGWRTRTVRPVYNGYIKTFESRSKET